MKSLFLKSARKCLTASRSKSLLKVGTLKKNISTIGLSSGGGYLQTGHRADALFENKPRILVTGASGQIGGELIPFLQDRYGIENVVSSDVKIPPTLHKLPSSSKQNEHGTFVYCDVTDFDQIARVVLEHRIDWIFHLAALLSAVGEQQPKLAIKINNIGTENILELSRLNNIRVYIPSSIAAFGPTTPQNKTPNLTIQRPTTIYGITKVYNELLGEYYFRRYGVDFRSLRYPGIISSKSMPGGGTTDYAVEIYHQALLKKKYKCFLSSDAMLPMMYMPDCIKATIQLMEADNSKLTERVYNVAGMSFTPKQVYESIKKHIPSFDITYEPDFRQNIAKTWPYSLDDDIARKDWQWSPDYDLENMTLDMLNTLSQTYNIPFSNQK